jgi:signal recognition particle subunit SRP54
MMPGLSDQVDQLDVDDKHIKRIEALCTSMTARERLQPEIIDVSRKRRIARGSGQDVSDVNKLLKSHEAMKKMMKQLDKLGLGAGLAKQDKLKSLRGLSADGQLAGNFDTGLLDKLGGAARGLGGAAKGLGSMMGLGGGGLPPGFDPSSLGLPGAPGGSPKGSARGGGGKADRAKQKAAAKQRRKNRKRK